MKKDIHKKYEKYKTKWLIDNRYTLDDVINYLEDCYNHQKENPKSSFRHFEKYEFDYKIYPTFEKWYKEIYKKNHI